jgi:hypothetical protein
MAEITGGLGAPDFLASHTLFQLGLIGAAGLASAVMLAWGLAAAIPILLHLLNRRRQRPIPWAAMQLLLQVIEKRAKRTRLEQFLLLALRVLILLTFGLALAQPYLSSAPDDASTTGSRPPQLWIIAVDTSYSMGYRANGQTRFEAAKSRAAELVSTSAQGDAYSLVALSKPSRAVIGTPTFDRSAVLMELQKLSVQDTGSTLGDSLGVIEEVLRAAAQAEGMPALVHIVFLSDLGRDCWQSAVDGEDRKKLQQLQKQSLVEVESFGDKAVNNVAIQAIRPASSRVMVGSRLQVEIVVESIGADVEHLPVQLEMNGHTIASDYIDIPEGQARSVRLEVVPNSTGETILTAAIPNDRLAADNRREHVIEIRKQFRILIVERERGDGRLVKLALQSSKSSSQTQTINTIPQLELPTVELSQWDLVVLNDVTNINQESLGRLERYARNAGSLVVLLGRHTKPEAWNSASEASESLLGFRLQEPTSEIDVALDPLEYRSPIVSPFAGFPDSGLLTTPIFRHWLIEAATGLTVDLATTNGKPLIVRKRVGSGWVASVLSAPEDGLEYEKTGSAWNAMATWPSFLPLMQQLVQVVVDTNVERMNLLAGDVLEGWIRDSSERQQIAITRPDGSESYVTTEAFDDSGQLLWYYHQTENRGIYQARSKVGLQSFAVNIAPIESRLTSVALAQLPSSTTDTQLQAVVDPARQSENDNRLTRMLLGLLLVLLLSESVLAWSLGRRIG